MATIVNPPPQLRIPNQFLSEPLTTAYFREIGVILFQLWKRSGGNDDDLANLILQVAINTEDIAENAAAIAINALNIISNADNIAINAANILINSEDITDNALAISQNDGRITELELKLFTLVNTAVNLTTELNQIIRCTNVADISITLNPLAIADEEVHIKRRGGGVNVIGTIDGLTDKYININGYSMHLFFTGSEWIEI